MKNKMIVGITRNNTIIVAKVENKKYFSVSFDELIPQKIDDDMIDERIDEIIEDLSSQYDDNIDKTREVINNEYDNYGIEGLFDISLYPYSFTFKEEEIYFISGGCGQIDKRDNIAVYEDKSITDRIFQLWDKYHLKKVDNVEIRDLFYDIEKNNSRKDFDSVMESLAGKILKK